MKKAMVLINGLMIFMLIITGCVPQPDEDVQIPDVIPTLTDMPPETPTEIVEEEVLYLNLIWHQHQPLYYKDDNDIYTRPWVRVHATKDYYDMASILEQYP